MFICFHPSLFFGFQNLSHSEGLIPVKNMNAHNNYKTHNHFGKKRIKQAYENTTISTQPHEPINNLLNNKFRDILT